MNPSLLRCLPWLWPLVMSVIAFCAMAHDKRQAIRGRRRTPEKTLLGLAVLGGSPGSILGMVLCRHKTRKPAFSIGLPVIFLVQVLIVWAIIKFT